MSESILGRLVLGRGGLAQVDFEPPPPPETPPSGGVVTILLGGDDITENVEYTGTTFQSLADGNVGRAMVRIRDLEHTFTPEYLRAGKTLELFIEGVRQWDGWVLGVQRGWPFEAGTGVGPDDEPRHWTLIGLDRNLLFQKRFLYLQSDPSDTSGIPDFPEDTSDLAAITAVLDDYVDLSGDGLSLSGIEEVASPGPFEDFTLGYIPAPLGVLFDDAAKITGAVFCIDPDRVVRYVNDRTVTAPRPLSDVVEDGATRYREMEAALDATAIANDALVWGAGVAGAGFGRHQDEDSKTAYGRWQWGEQYSAGLDLTLERRARTYVEGSPSHRRGHNEPVPVVTCVIHDDGFRVGQVADFRAHMYGYQEDLPIRAITMTFPEAQVVRYELELTLRVDTPFGIPDLWGFPPYGPWGPTPDEIIDDDPFGEWTLVDHFDDEPSPAMILGYKQGYSSGTSHPILLPDGSGYPGGVVGGYPTERQVLLVMLIQTDVPELGTIDITVSPWDNLLNQIRACTHAFPSNTGHPSLRTYVFRLDVDANPGAYPETGAVEMWTSTEATQILWATVLVGGVENLTVGPSTTQFDQPDWITNKPVVDLGKRALYLSVAYNIAWDHLDYPGLGNNPQDHDTSIVTGIPVSNTGIEGEFQRLIAAVGDEKTLLVDWALSPPRTGAALPDLDMTGYTGTGGSQKLILTQQYGFSEGTGYRTLKTPPPVVTGADVALQPGGNRYVYNTALDVADSHFKMAGSTGIARILDVYTGLWGIVDDPGGVLGNPIAQGDFLEDDPSAPSAPLAPWGFAPLDILQKIKPGPDAFLWFDLNLIRFDPNGDESAVIGGNPYKAAWMAELELFIDLSEGTSEADTYPRLRLYTALDSGTGILPEVHADPNTAFGTYPDDNLTIFAPWDHAWEVNLSDDIGARENEVDPATSEFYVRIEAGKEAYDAAAGAWWVRVKMWRVGEFEPGWQIEDVFGMYKPGATTYLGETNLTGRVWGPTSSEYGFVEWYGQVYDAVPLGIDAWWTKQGKA